jgi:hypothetical protein
VKFSLLKLTLLLALFLSIIPYSTALAKDDDEVEVLGLIESLPSNGLIGEWRISGRTFRVSSATNIDQEHGQAVVGAFVEAKGRPQTDGSIEATKIEVKSSPGGGSGTFLELNGVVESLPSSGLIGEWRVSGQIVRVDAATIINQELGSVVVGTTVEVKGFSQTDGSIKATRIEVKSQPGGSTGSFIEFYGLIESLPANGLIGDWRVGGWLVNVDSSTRIDQEKGPAVVGARVEVKGRTRSDNSIAASEIEVKLSSSGGSGESVEMHGILESLPSSGLIGDWRVSGQVIHVTTSTKIKRRNRIVIGGRVEVKGQTQPDGSIIATKVKGES